MRLRNPEFWRDRAEEARNAAENMVSADGRKTMLDIARQYEALAKLGEEFQEKHGIPNGGLG